MRNALIVVLLFSLSGWISAATAASDMPSDADNWFEHALDAALSAEDQHATATDRHQWLLEQARTRGPVPVIVRLRTDMMPESALDANSKREQRNRLATTQQRIVDRLSSTAYRSDAERGLKRFNLTPALALLADAQDLQELLSDPEVLDIIEDRAVPPTLADSVPLIGADAVGEFLGYTGEGQVVAILDTGIDKNHPFLADKVVSEACYSSNVPVFEATSLCPGGVTESTANNSGLDCSISINGCGHGTHVAGIAAGSGDTFSGVAKDARLIAIQVFTRFDSADDCGGSPPCVLSFTSDQIKGLERVHALRNS